MSSTLARAPRRALRRHARRLAALTAVFSSSWLSVAAAMPAHAAETPTGPPTPVVVRSDGSLSTAQLHDIVAAVHGRVTRDLGIISGVAATVPAGAVSTLATEPHVREVSRDGSVTLASTSYDPTGDTSSMYNIERIIGARTMWGKGFTGKGVDVALVDSGVAPVSGINASQLVEGPDLTPESQSPDTAHLDTYGHGTFMAGIIAGHDSVVTSTAQAVNDTQDYLGVAPDARIVSVKVADYHGDTDVSQVIAGIDWVVQHAHDSGLNIRVLNLSFGTNSAQSYLLDPLAYAAEQAWKHGIVVVASAGNSGASNGRMTDPAIDPFVLAVGADNTQSSVSTNDDTIPSFSSLGDGVRNPDLVAPGVHVQGLQVPGSYVDTQYGATAAFGGRFFRGSGTSQAAAVVSGAAALLLQQYPSLTPDQVKSVLTANASTLYAANLQAQGAGLVQMRNMSTWGLLSVVQPFAPSTGAGSLEASRGSTHLVLATPNGNVTLTGEQDLMGAPVVSAALAAQEATASSWTGGSWNGNVWAGNGFTSSSWASSSWASSSWASSSWASSSWASSSWADGSWSSSSWASSSWASSSWASSMWASSSWASSSWADANWASSSWG